MGFARLAEAPVRKLSGKSDAEKLSPMERIACSSIGGALGTWNQPIEVVRVEVSIVTVSLMLSSIANAFLDASFQMQSMAKNASTVKRGVFGTLAYVYRENGLKGLYRGVTPRIALGIWQTVSMVAFAGERTHIFSLLTAC